MKKLQEVIVFNSFFGESEFQVLIDGDLDTVWVTQTQMIELFGKAKATVSEHIKNVFSDGELVSESTVQDF